MPVYLVVLKKNRCLLWHFWHKLIGSMDRWWKTNADTASITSA